MDSPDINSPDEALNWFSSLATGQQQEVKNLIITKCLSSNDVLNYLSHLKEIKKSIPGFTSSEDENVFTIYDSKNIPKISLSRDIYKIFQEIEV